MAKKQKNPHAVALGRLGGMKGGKVRNARKGLGSLTPERRKEIARMGVEARWRKGA
jgi:hypothetical protein